MFRRDMNVRCHTVSCSTQRRPRDSLCFVGTSLHSGQDIGVAALTGSPSSYKIMLQFWQQSHIIDHF